MRYKKNKPDNPRYISFLILKENPSFYQKSLSKFLNKSLLSSPDRALVTNLVNGVLRESLFLDWAISMVSKPPLDKIDKDVLTLLRLGAYQLLRTDRIPPYAAISETVEVSKSFCKMPAVKFVNAILRQINRKREILLAGPPADDIINHLSIVYSHPEWLVERWYKRWGEDAVREIFRFNNNPPPVTLRFNPLKTSLENLQKCFKESEIEISPLKFLPEGFEALSNINLENLPYYEEGLFTIQGESSMFAVKILDPVAGEKVLDLCSAPGNKATHMAEVMNNAGEILAVDISEKRLEFLFSACRRLNINIINTLVSDVLNLGEELNGKFDRLLLDAPCSGTGILSRRSDLRWNKSPEDINRLSLLQKRLLKRAADFVKPGGSMVYSVFAP